jgi:membrane-associated phospholipid phosphatase
MSSRTSLTAIEFQFRPAIGVAVRRFRFRLSEFAAVSGAVPLTGRIAAGFSGAVGVLVCLHAQRVSEWSVIAAGNFAVVGLILLLALAHSEEAGRRRNTFVTAARQWLPLLLFLLWFEQSAQLAHIFFSGWRDGLILHFERGCFGFDPTILAQRFISYSTTEVMNFGYFSYYFYLPVIGAILLLQKRRAAFDFTMLASTLAYVTCNVCYLLFPTEGPAHSLRYSVGLHGGFFAGCVDFVEGFGRVLGSAFPSAHVAGSAVAWLCAWRYVRRLAWMELPIVLLMCAATVYLRFHYVSDVAAGTAVAVGARILAGYLMPDGDVANTPRKTHLRCGRRVISFLAIVTLAATTALARIHAGSPLLAKKVTANQNAVFENEIQLGLAAMYDGRFDSAQIRFLNLRRMRPDYPAGPVFMELLNWWRALPDPGNDALAALFLQSSAAADAACRQWLSSHPNDPEGWLYLASAEGAAARFHVSIRRDMWRALQEGLAAHKAVLRAQALDGTNPDNGLGLGAYDYFSATVPALIRPFAWMLGLQGDRGRGLTELRETAERGRHARMEAVVVLASAAWAEKDYAGYERELRPLAVAAPDNAVIAGWQVSGYLRLHDWQGAEAITRQFENRPAAKGWTEFQRARLALARQDFSAAASHFSACIANAGCNRTLRAMAYEGRAKARDRLDGDGDADHDAARQTAPAAMALANDVLSAE